MRRVSLVLALAGLCSLGILAVVVTNRWSDLEKEAAAASAAARKRKAESGALRVLFLTDRVIDFDHGMDRHFFFWFEAAERSAEIDAVLWGRGFDLYSREKTLSQNIAERFGSDTYFDAVVVYGIVPNAEVVALTSAGKTISVVREHECFEASCKSVILGNNASVVMLTYSQELAELARQVNSAAAAASPGRPMRRLFVHSPHCADRGVFFKQDLQWNRHSGVVVVGAIKGIYPLRQKWRELVKSGAIQGSVRRHPGYWSKSSNAAVMLRQTVEYARLLKSAKIVLFDASVFKYQLQKFAETALAGALIISDVPLDDDTGWREVIVEVDAKMNDTQLAAVVEWWSNHPRQRLERVRKAQQFVLSRYTYESAASQLAMAIRMQKAGQHGIWYPYPFSIGCAARNREVFTNEWC